MSDSKVKTALVTGANRGIERALPMYCRKDMILQ